MAPGPHVKIAKDMISFDIGQEKEEDDHDDDIQEMRYYESHKIIGRLYRAIDEREVFQSIQQTSSQESILGLKNRTGYSNTSVMNAVWEFVEKRCRSLKWKHKLEWARDIREW
jgi:hypothetical protein